MKNALFFCLIAVLFFTFPKAVQAQASLLSMSDTKEVADTTVVEKPQYYKTAEIAFEIENVNRYIKEQQKELNAARNVSGIDTSFTRLSRQIQEEFDDFSAFNKQNLSKFFLLNTKKVWRSYRSQLTNWQDIVSKRISMLMDISDRVREKEKLWNATSGQAGSEGLPPEIKNRISGSVNDLHLLGTDIFDVVGQLSVLDSRIADQIIGIDQHIEEIEELHQNYRANVFKITQPAVWNLQLKGSYEGTLGSRTKKAWYENTKSLRNSLPSVKDHFSSFITWCIFIILVIASLRYFFMKHPSRHLKPAQHISELIIRHPLMSILYLVLFNFDVYFNNLPLAISGIISIITLIITYFLLKSYISNYARRLILTFLILLGLNTFEIVFWYFGNYARLYLLLEAGLGVMLVFPFIGAGFKAEMLPVYLYRRLVAVLRYPIFLLYLIAFFANIIGAKDLTVLFLKIGAEVTSSIIVLIGAWEVSKSCLHVLFDILGRKEKLKNQAYLPMLRKRLKLFMTIFFIMIMFDSFMVIVELDTPFVEIFGRFMVTERHIGSFIFSYGSIFQFLFIMAITWGLTTIIKIIFTEGNFKKTQRMRGVPAAISTTLRLIVALTGFFLALSGAGIDLTKIGILFGAFGVGIGFGLQNIVNNFISGLILIYERPIQVGDTIEINSLMGEVKKIGIRSSNVRTYDGAEVVVPNSILVSDQLVNWTLSDNKRRLDIPIGVKYGTDPNQVISILKKVAKKNPLVAKDPEPRVLFHEFADSSLNFRLLCWVLFEHGIQAKSDLSVAIDKAFKDAGIEIPFPQLDLHLIDTPDHKATISAPHHDPEDNKPLIAGGSGIGDAGGEK